MVKSRIRKGVENRESVVSKFGLTKPTGRKTISIMGGIPHKLVGSDWIPLTKVVK